MRLWKLVGLQSNAGHPESVLKSSTSGKELGSGADKWQPWLAAHLEAPELRLWALSLSRGEGKNVFPMPFFFFIYYHKVVVSKESWTYPYVIMLLKHHHLLSESNGAVCGCKQFVAALAGRGDGYWWPGAVPMGSEGMVPSSLNAAMGTREAEHCWHMDICMCAHMYICMCVLTCTCTCVCQIHLYICMCILHVCVYMLQLMHILYVQNPHVLHRLECGQGGREIPRA